MEFKTIDKIISSHGRKVENLLPMLMEIQYASEGRYIDSETADYVATIIGIPNAQMSEVLSFFAALNKEKKGHYHIEMCNSTVCRVNDNHLIQAYLEETLKIRVGETSSDGMFSLDYAPCFGACDISPSVRINKVAYGNLTIDKLSGIIDKLRGDFNG